jgi:hypothetical protein
LAAVRRNSERPGSWWTAFPHRKVAMNFQNRKTMSAGVRLGLLLVTILILNNIESIR